MQKLVELRPGLEPYFQYIGYKENSKPKVGILGASGKLGSHTAMYLGQEHWDVTAATHNTEIPLHATGQIDSVIPQFDITDLESVNKTVGKMADQGVRTILNMSGVLQVDTEEHTRGDRESKMYRVHVVGARNVADACKRNKIKLIHATTEYVFDGKKPYPEKYSESDHPNTSSSNPTWYGQSHAIGDQMVLQGYPEGIELVRIGQVQHTMGCLFTATLAQLKKGEPFTRSSDQFASPLSDATMAISLLLIEHMLHTNELDDQKTLHVGAADDSTVLEACFKLAAKYGLAEKAIDLITGVPLQYLVDTGVQKVVRPIRPVLGTEITQKILPGVLQPISKEIEIYHRTYST